MTELTLVSHHLCPYAQRAAISLDEKGVIFTRIDVNLADKPSWFLALSPLGKVPLLRVRDGNGETLLFESEVILEYLEDSQPWPLHPAEPLARAHHRAWIEFGSALLSAIWRFYSAGDRAQLDLEARALAAMFERVEDQLGKGPWFDGKSFSLVDAAFGPVFRYFDSFDEIGNFMVFDSKPRTAAWRAALAKRPSVQRAVAPDYDQRLMAFLGRRDSALARLMT